MEIRRGVPRPILLAALIAAVAEFQCPAQAFTLPSRSYLTTRGFVANGSNVKFVSPFANNGRSNVLVSMASEITASEGGQGEDRKEPLFESLGKGIVRDYKARLPHLISDITDGINVQVRNIGLRSLRLYAASG